MKFRVPTESKQMSNTNSSGMMEVILSLWAWLAIILVIIPMFCVELVVFLITWPFDKTRYCVGRIFRFSSVISIRLNPMWNFKIQGQLPQEPQRTIIVSNHLSWADTALISHLPWEMKWLSKSGIFLIPFVGWSMYLAGDISLHRGERASAKDAMGLCKKWLEKGANIMIFPEGTRSRNGKLGDFKDGAFRLAIETKSDILPLAIAGTQNSIPPLSWKMSYAKGLVTVGVPISTKNMTLDNLEILKQQTRTQIEQMYKTLEPLVEQS